MFVYGCERDAALVRRRRPPRRAGRTRDRAPVPAEEAARVLFALERAPAALARSLLDDVVAGDARLAWRGARSGSRATAHGHGLEDAEFVVFDLETTGLSASRDRIVRDRRGAGSRRSSVDETFETLVNPASRCRRPIAALTGIRAGRAARRAAARARRAPLPRVRGRRAARRAQRALRHRVPRPRGRAPHRPTGRGAGRRHGVARAAAAPPPERALLAPAARALLRHDVASRAIARCPTRSRRPRS